QAMQRLVWTETVVEGGKLFTGKLQQPPANLGFYRDAKVIAFRTPGGEKTFGANPKVTSSGGPVNDPSGMLDDNRQTSTTITAGSDNVAWIQFEYPEPIDAQAITIGGRSGRAGVPLGRVMASEDGRTFRTIVNLPGTQL